MIHSGKTWTVAATLRFISHVAKIKTTPKNSLTLEEEKKEKKLKWEHFKGLTWQMKSK
jgi:hypothetical protein